jgi:hypothetical protein
VYFSSQKLAIAIVLLKIQSPDNILIKNNIFFLQVIMNNTPIYNSIFCYFFNLFNRNPVSVFYFYSCCLCLDCFTFHNRFCKYNILYHREFTACINQHLTPSCRTLAYVIRSRVMCCVVLKKKSR